MITIIALLSLGFRFYPLTLWGKGFLFSVKIKVTLMNNVINREAKWRDIKKNKIKQELTELFTSGGRIFHCHAKIEGYI